MYGERVILARGVAGLGVSYYLYPTTGTPYLIGGFGYSTWFAPFEEDSEIWVGLGASLGIGYEFARHWSVELVGTWGSPRTKEAGSSFRTDAVSVSAAVTGLAY